MLAAGEVDQAPQAPGPETGESGSRTGPEALSSLYSQHRLTDACSIVPPE